MTGTTGDTASPNATAAGRDWLVQGWATAKAAAGLAAAPVGVPLAGLRAVTSTASTTARVRRFADLVEGWHAGAPTRPDHLRVTHRPAAGRYVITSDLHRCIPGRLDWPRRQGVVELYADLLDHYGTAGWTLVENGDVEDFWMVGGTRWGAEYDASRLLATAAGPFADEFRRDLYGRHIARIVDNYPTIYGRLAELAADGRYLRTTGNHDDVYEDEVVVGHLARHLPGMDCVDVVVLDEAVTPNGGWPQPGPARAVIAHGHHTDAWNGPGASALGKAFTWLGTTLDDVPGISPIEAPPSPAQLESLLAGRGRNRLITVDRRFGGNLRFDSLDEELLFSALGPLAESGPWILFGHTHFPMLSPVSRTGGRWERYANSGAGILRGAVTALEWDHGEVRLVLWRHEGGGLRRYRLLPDGSRLRTEPDGDH